MKSLFKYHPKENPVFVFFSELKYVGLQLISEELFTTEVSLRRIQTLIAWHACDMHLDAYVVYHAMS